MAKIESVNEHWHKHKMYEIESFIKKQLTTLYSNIEYLKRGEAYIIGESLVFRNYADAKIVNNTLIL